MVRASLLYAVVTILLALVDAIREKVKWGKVANINHDLSTWLACMGGGIVVGMLFCHFPISWDATLMCLFISLSFIAIRLVFFDPAQNLFRIFLKTNPTMRLDYSSTTTSSWIDQHVKLSFWQKRAIGIVGWVIVLLVYNKIF